MKAKANRVKRWHERRFLRATDLDVMRKLLAEVYELNHVLHLNMPMNEKRQEIADEAADVLITLLRLFSMWMIDPDRAFEKKFAEVIEKYPV